MSRLYVTLAVLAALGAPAAAQEREPLNALTMTEAVREAVDHNLTVAAERYNVSVARARIITASLRPNPVVTASVVLPDRAVFDNAVSPREQVFRADVPFERGAKRERRVEVAEAALSVAELQLVNTIRTAVLDLQGAFVDVLLAKANAALAQESLDAFNELVRVNTERVRTGDLSGLELTRSRLAALQFQNDVRQQRSKLAIARNRLRILLGRIDGPGVDATGDFRHDEPAVDPDQVRQRAIALRPDVQALRLEQARSAAELRLQLAQGKVDFTLSAEVHRQHQPMPAEARGFLYGMFVSAPLPLFSRNQGEIERARQEDRQAGARVRALEAQIASDVATVCEEYAASRSILETVERQMLAKARDVRRTTEYAYRRGEASFVEFLDAVRAFNETMQSYNEARAGYARSLYELDAVSGQVTP